MPTFCLYYKVFVTNLLNQLLIKRTFYIGSENEKFPIYYGGYSGTAGELLIKLILSYKILYSFWNSFQESKQVA